MQREVALGRLLKMNFFTYYLEHQFAFQKHPDIGPKDGSMTSKELKSLINFAANRSTEVIGCQQSFGHFGTILWHDQYKGLRENGDILDQTNEQSYKLLDDLYSEQIPLLKSNLFNVCCDETVGLGTGPSKPLADKIGVGALYARHMERVHELITGKYGKRMMMWGDIVLMHPESLSLIPKDTIMLSWGYSPLESFESAILPFKNSGYQFFICPGISNWSRMIPDFNAAVINIHNYVRDGARLGALGMLNTSWADDGETLFPCNWHGEAWAAECAWNGSTTSIDDFDRRIGGVLFGEKGDHFGQAIRQLSKLHQLPGYDSMMDSRFWQIDSCRVPVTREVTQQQARALLEIVDAALQHLNTAKSQASTLAMVSKRRLTNGH
jgi:hypothetical protein